LCARLGITGHGITVPPAADLPERWLSMLTRYRRRKPDVTSAPGSWASTAAAPEPGLCQGSAHILLDYHWRECALVVTHNQVQVCLDED